MLRPENTRPLKTALGGSPQGGAKPSGVRGAAPSRPNAGTLGQWSQLELCLPATDAASLARDGSDTRSGAGPAARSAV